MKFSRNALESSELENSLLAHPWHGVRPVREAERLRIFVENVPFSKMKYEVDAETGLLFVDHAQETTALTPAAYGFVPRTLCGARVAQLNSRLRGDLSALDIFLLSERAIEVPGVLVDVRLVGVIPVQDENYVDDKLIGVLNKDAVFGGMSDISEVPVHHIDRISHFLSQEGMLGTCKVGDAQGATRAHMLLQAAIEDYQSKFGEE